MNSTDASPKFINPKTLLFVSDFVLKYFIFLPYLFYQFYLLYYDSFQFIPYIIFVFMMTVACLVSLSKEELTFSKNIFNTFWIKKIEIYKKLKIKVELNAALVQAVDDSILNSKKPFLIALTIMIFVVCLVPSIFMIFTYAAGKLSIVNFLYSIAMGVPFLLMGYFGLVFPCQIKKHQNGKKGIVKPLHYWFNLRINSPVRNTDLDLKEYQRISLARFIIFIFISLLLFIDLCYSHSAITYLWMNYTASSNRHVILTFIYFLENSMMIVFFQNSLNYFYADAFLQEANAELKVSNSQST